MKKQFLQLLVRIGANAAGIYVAAYYLSRISYGDSLEALLVSAVILSLVNAVVRPFVVVLSLPAYIVTLGLFSLVVNAGMLYLVDFFYAPFEVRGLLAPIVAGIIIGLINYIVTRLFDLVSKEDE